MNIPDTSIGGFSLLCIGAQTYYTTNIFLFSQSFLGNVGSLQGHELQLLFNKSSVALKWNEICSPNIFIDW